MQVLQKQPFAARIETVDHLDNHAVYYICSQTPPTGLRLPDGGNLVSYLAPMGRLASFRPHLGEKREIQIPRGSMAFTVTERAMMTSWLHTNYGWDAAGEFLRATALGVFREGIESFRARTQLQDRRQRAEVAAREAQEEALRSSVLQREAEASANAEAEAASHQRLLEEAEAALRDALQALHAAEEAEETGADWKARRQTIRRMELRDQSILDEVQDEVFRLPLDMRLMLSGPPGTGKTTTLIKRLSQKRDFDYLGTEEQALVSKADRTKFFHANNWVMFTPNNTLKQFLKETFASAGIAADESRVRIWAEDRVRLARNVFKILAATMDDKKRLVRAEQERVAADSRKLREMADAFWEWLEASRRDELAEILTHELPDVADVLGRVELARDRARGAVYDWLDEVADAATAVRKMVGQIRIKAGDFKGLERISSVVSVVFGPEKEIKAAEERLVKCAKPSRNLDLTGEQTAVAAAAAGLALKVGRFRKKLAGFSKHLLAAVPNNFEQFRRLEAGEKGYYSQVTESQTVGNRGQVTDLELDIILYGLLKTARELLKSLPWLADEPKGPVDYIKQYADELHVQVLVDEATDFSSVQIACMEFLAHPQFRSFFLSGDVRQRMTEFGIQSEDELKWIDSHFEVQEISTGYRQTSRLTQLAQLISSIAGKKSPVKSAFDDHDECAMPALLEGEANVEDVAKWIAGRIDQIQRRLGALPSIAVFVESDEKITPLVESLNRSLRQITLSAVGCEGGRFNANDEAVRVFDVRNVKGLEFEAVFFCSVDRMMERNETLFDKFLYVGATRSAEYLGVTCEGKLPARLEELRPHFSTSDW